MSWIVKGYDRNSGTHTGHEDRIVFTKEAQYVADMMTAVRKAVGEGCVELLIVKTNKDG